MQFKTLIATAALASTTSALPAQAISMAAAVPDWTIVGLKRTCNADNSSCTWAFSVDTHTSPATPCSVTVNRGARPASQTNWNNVACGPYTLGAGWSNQFGDANAFTTLSVVNVQAKNIVYPAYEDSVLVNGQTVSPDRSYPVQKTP